MSQLIEENSYSLSTDDTGSPSYTYSPLLTNKNAKYQLRQKKNASSDTLNDKSGLDESDLKTLNSLIYMYKRDWKRITPKFKALTKKNISKEALRKVSKDFNRSQNTRKLYSKEEDHKIYDLVEEFGLNWKEIAKKFPDREPLSIRDRYYNLLKQNKGKIQVSESRPRDSISLNTLICDIELDITPPFLELIYSMEKEKSY